MNDSDLEEGSPQWMAYLSDGVCPICGRGIQFVLKTSCRCAGAYPCGHKVLRGDDAVEIVTRLISGSG